MLVIIIGLFFLTLVSLLIVYVGNELDYHRKLGFLSVPLVAVGICGTLLFVVLSLTQMVFVTDVYYDRKAINSMFGTSYTMDEVRLFRDEIKARHETKFPVTAGLIDVMCDRFSLAELVFLSKLNKFTALDIPEGLAAKLQAPSVGIPINALRKEFVRAGLEDCTTESPVYKVLTIAANKVLNAMNFM